MAKFVIAGICSCPRFALAEAVAEKLKVTLPSFQVHKIMLDEGESWDQWLHDVCVRNGWVHGQSPIIWRELVMRGSRGILIGNADDFLEYAKMYYGITINLTTLDLLRLAHDNRRLHLEKSIRLKIEKESMQTYRIGVLAACHKATLMILFQILRDGTLGEDKALILQLYCHSGHADRLITIKNDLFDLASPYLRDVIVGDDLESAVRDCSLVIWLEEPFHRSKVTVQDAESSVSHVQPQTKPQSPKISIVSRLNPQFDSLAGTITREAREQAIKAKPPSDKFNPLTRSERPDSLPRESSQGRFSTSSESFVLNQIEINTLSLESELDTFDPEQSVDLRPTPIRAATMHRSSIVESDLDIAKKTLTKADTYSDNDLRIRSHAETIGKVAEGECRIVMAGDHPSLNYCAYIVANVCPHLAPHLIAVSDIEIRARAALARKLGIRPSEVRDVLVWGNPGDSFTVDVSRATVASYDGAIWKREGFTRPLESVFPYWKWFRRELKNELLQNGEQHPTGHVAAMALAHCVTTCLRRWYHEEPLELTSVGIVSDGSYSIPRGNVMTCPVYLSNGSWQSASLELSEEMLSKLNRLVRRCAECQYQYCLT